MLGNDVIHDKHCNQQVESIKTIGLKLSRKQPKLLKNACPVHDEGSE